VQEDDGGEISVGLFKQGSVPLGEEEAAEALGGDGDIYAEVVLDGERVALVRITTRSGRAWAFWEVVGEATSARAAELALEKCTRLVQEYATGVLS